MFKVEEEAVPGGSTEVVTGDSHVSVGLVIDLVTDFLEALDATLGGAD